MDVIEWSATFLFSYESGDLGDIYYFNQYMVDSFTYYLCLSHTYYLCLSHKNEKSLPHRKKERSAQDAL